MKAFDSSEIKRRKAEAKEQWGQTPAYREYEVKTKSYSEEKWDALAGGTDRIMAAFAACMQEGEASDSARAQDLVSSLQSHITQNYYRCTKEILAGLGQLYVQDERFRKNIDQHGSGTAAFVCEAIGIYCGS